MDQWHIPVLLNEAITNLQLKAGDTVIDGTVGGGGHLVAIAKVIGPQGKILGFDLDELALQQARQQIKENKISPKVTLVKSNFKKLKQKIYDQGITNVDGIIFDLGLSTGELKDPKRGFSFTIDAPLDMRFDTAGMIKAADILNTWPEKKLALLFKENGEEPLARQIAAKIFRQRKIKKLERTFELVDLIASVYGAKYNRRSKSHPATKVFQALRIAVNDELENLKSVLPDAVDLLNPGRRLAVIAFHSLEDRIVKNYFRQESKDCLCPKQMPICQCQHKAAIKLITKKPITPNFDEINQNPKSRSAKMRVAEKI